MTDYCGPAVDAPWDASLWPNFTATEIACRCCGEVYINEAALGALQRLRDALGGLLTITSRHRCRCHNQAVGGAAASARLKLAFDVAVLSYARGPACARAWCRIFALRSHAFRPACRPRPARCLSCRNVDLRPGKPRRLGRAVSERNAGHRWKMTMPETLPIEETKMNYRINLAEYAQYSVLAIFVAFLGTFARLPFWLYPADLKLPDGKPDPRAGRLNVMKVVSELAGVPALAAPAVTGVLVLFGIQGAGARFAAVALLHPIRSDSAFRSSALPSSTPSSKSSPRRRARSLAGFSND